jgi:hypothetical protein
MFWAVAVALPRNHQSAGEEEPLTALGIEQKNPLRAALSRRAEGIVVIAVF